MGEADYSSSMHPIDALDGTSTDFGDKTSVDGMHCTCPSGFTGVLCDVEFESCNQDTHPCYNNGKCVPGLVTNNATTGSTGSSGSGSSSSSSSSEPQLYSCNCADAIVNGIPHVGKYCEHAANEFCDDAKTIFCIHGTCNRDYPYVRPAGECGGTCFAPPLLSCLPRGLAYTNPLVE
jgi:hypothetical protein